MRHTAFALIVFALTLAFNSAHLVTADDLVQTAAKPDFSELSEVAQYGSDVIKPDLEVVNWFIHQEIGFGRFAGSPKLTCEDIDAKLASPMMYAKISVVNHSRVPHSVNVRFTVTSVGSPDGIRTLSFDQPITFPPGESAVNLFENLPTRIFAELCVVEVLVDSRKTLDEKDERNNDAWGWFDLR